ncbi:3-oxoacyl-[acyl-carrier protein] reductase [Paraburkholderia sp. BL23I1N1]|uniref:SDR family NAD(P)-dependent oxidoreductase n=1 Tax=Paraburkholderia sp. BL23I1N1 TaxID=1938802 RepID=UPI000E761136|nr:SDR family oxidoreductase [Paraburkholderia sp. BL23I1N1]RKE36370.1 3-oxoacyl-[acyl-carrier protein] reductase [Paraburkholderia sp. BL23I1N1]
MTTTRKVAVITGAAQGFGQSISIGLAKRGVDIVAVDLAASDETIRAVEDAGTRGVGLIADVSDPDTTGRLEALLRKDFGRCDILVNNAGIYPNVPITQVDYALWQRVQRINLDSQFLMVKAVLPLMMDRKWGRIVNITSNSVALVVPGLSHYIASKAGVIGFTRGLATDVAEYGITVNAVGPTASLTTGGKAHIKPEHIEELARTQVIKRPGTAEDIVGTVLFLAGDDSAFVTGQTIMADGGLVRL